LDGDTEAFLKQWAASRAGDNLRFAEALLGLVDAYLTLHDIDETSAIREFLTVLAVAVDLEARKEHLLDARLRATKKLSGKQVL
jgi:hypothetical protein